MPRLRAVFALTTTSLAFAAAIAVGCADEVVYVVAGEGGAAEDVVPDRRRPSTQASGDAAGDDDDDDVDAGLEGGGGRDANGPGTAGAECSFNHDCQLALRCECDGECSCKPGPRGTKPAGQLCDDQYDCVSAVCLEGTGDVLRCSDECETKETCPPELPLCANVSLVGRICVRAQP